MAESGATGAASSSLSLEDLVKAFKTFSQLANEDLVAQFTRILQDHEELQIKNARLRTAHEVDCESIAHLRAEVAKDEDLLKVQEEKRKALKKDLAAAHAEIRSAKKELEEKTARATELRNGLDTRDREIKDLNRAVDQERTAAQKARSAQQQAAKRIVALEDDLAKTQRFLQDARDELDRMRSMGLTLTKQPRETRYASPLFPAPTAPGLDPVASSD
ncbi:hypothetical protein VTK73DRAFT_4344 [Phialemonium thermophilum]|uniref:Uncharacterized protein n=1 Tax=Phialemonium thermophilum TaxID=223376 RepID=A0ABR3VB49_9PEZI